MLPDSGRRRHLSWGMDFDTRCLTLSTAVEDHWTTQAREMALENQARTRAALVSEFGEHDIEAKIENFIAINTKPFSVLAHHNHLFNQVRNAFTMGYYYAALVGACALGERILNHLVLDLRGFYTATPEYRRVHRKNSFDDWRVPIEVLEAWNVLIPAAAAEFRMLMKLRHRSIHFDPNTYRRLRDDALAAILHMRTIIEGQFGSHTAKPWFITGTKGHVFIKRDYEGDPFVKTYFLPNCPFVGPLFAIDFVPSETGLRTRFHDLPDYGDGPWTDEEFAGHYNNRDPDMIVKPDTQ
jgi:hypothetical protein